MRVCVGKCRCAVAVNLREEVFNACACMCVCVCVCLCVCVCVCVGVCVCERERVRERGIEKVREKRGDREKAPSYNHVFIY